MEAILQQESMLVQKEIRCAYVAFEQPYASKEDIIEEDKSVKILAKLLLFQFMSHFMIIECFCLT